MCCHVHDWVIVETFTEFTYCVFIYLSNFVSSNFCFRFSFWCFKYYEPVVWNVWCVLVGWNGSSSVVVIIISRVWSLLSVGILTCWVRLKAANESSNVCVSWSSMLSICLFISPNMISFFDFEDSSVRRLVNWSRNVELLSFPWQLDGSDKCLLQYRLALIWTVHSMFCVQRLYSC